MMRPSDGFSRSPIHPPARRPRPGGSPARRGRGACTVRVSTALPSPARFSRRGQLRLEQFRDLFHSTSALKGEPPPKGPEGDGSGRRERRGARAPAGTAQAGRFAAARGEGAALGKLHKDGVEPGIWVRSRRARSGREGKEGGRGCKDGAGRAEAAVGTFSMMRPAYITRMRRASEDTVARSWLIQISAVPRSRTRLRISVRIWAWIDTSSASSLVADDQAPPVQQRDGNGDALAHAAQN